MLTKDELPECPVATTVALIGNKWKLLIITPLVDWLASFHYHKLYEAELDQQMTYASQEMPPDLKNSR